MVCPSCASETPLSEETRETLRAIASERANTDQAARKLQEARQRLSRTTSIIWPLLEHPVILGFVPTTMVLAPAGYLAHWTSAYLSFPLRFGILFVLFGALFLAMLYPRDPIPGRRVIEARDEVRAVFEANQLPREVAAPTSGAIHGSVDDHAGDEVLARRGVPPRSTTSVTSRSAAWPTARFRR